MTDVGEQVPVTERGEPWPVARWVCPHDPNGMDRDTGTYCGAAVRQTVPYERMKGVTCG
jgi:hypothetical protein